MIEPILVNRVLPFTTLRIYRGKQMDRKFYGPVNNQTKYIKKFYGPIMGVSMESVSVRSGGAGNISSIDFSIFKQSFISNGGKYSLNGKDLSFIDIYLLVRGTNYPIRITANYSDGGTEIITANESSNTITANWGISLSGTLSTGTDYVDITLGEESQAKKITKLYGAVKENVLIPTIRSGETGNVTDFDEAIFIANAPSYGLDTNKTISYLDIQAAPWDLGPIVRYRVYVKYTDSTSGLLTTLNGIDSSSLLSNFGITAEETPTIGGDYIDYIGTEQTRTKLIYQDFGI